ncbi:MAG: hypothetical protein GX542_00920 [Rhodococcus sp.]|nr:hypothetical protein [Rhodococcus sp. (in: high G+C Gram-positive bacteria)]
MPKLTDDRLLTDDDLVAIRDYITGWEPARDRRFLGAARLLLAHADALAEDLVRLREDHSRLQAVLWTLLNELSPGVVEELRAVWGNTNTRILEDRIEDARRALEGGA